MERKNSNSAEEYQTKHVTIPLSVSAHTRLKLAAMNEQITLGNLTRKALLKYISDDAPRRRKGK